MFERSCFTFAKVAGGSTTNGISACLANHQANQSRLNQAEQRLAECLSAADPRLFDPYDTARIIALERPISLLECITDFDMLAAFVSEVVAELVDDMKMQAQYARRRPSGSRKEKEKVGAADAADAVDAV